MKKTLSIVLFTIITAISINAQLIPLTRSNCMLSGPVEEVVNIIPGGNISHFVFNRQGYVIKGIENIYETTYEWVDGTLKTSEEAKYYYQISGDTLMITPDNESVGLYINDPHSGLTTFSHVSTPGYETVEYIELTEDGYNAKATKNGLNSSSQTKYLFKDNYNNPYIYDVANSDGSTKRLYSLYKYFDKPFTHIHNPNDANEIFINALYYIHIAKDMSEGKKMLNDALNAYQIKKDSKGILDCQMEKVRLYCVLNQQKEALEMASKIKFDNELEQAYIYNTVADSYANIKSIEKADRQSILEADSLNILSLKCMLEYHKNEKGLGWFPDDIRMQFYKIYYSLMAQNDYLKAVQYTQWQLEEMDAYGLSPNNPEYQRAVAYHINASYANNPQFVSLAEKCENLIDHLNTYPIEILATHPTLRTELLDAAKYCMVVDKWTQAGKFLNAFMEREFATTKDIIDFSMIGGNFYQSIGDINQANAFFVGALDYAETDFQKIMPLLSICNYYFNGDLKETYIGAFNLITEYLDKIDADKIESPLLNGYCMLIIADLGNFVYRHKEKNNLEDLVDNYLWAIKYFESAQSPSLVATAHKRLALLYESAGDFTNAEKYYAQALASGTVLPGSALEFELTTSKAGLYEKMQQTAEANEAYRTAIDILRQRIKRTFIFLTERQREGFWAQQQPLFKALSHDSGNSSGELRYNAALLNKNLLLSSASRLRGIVEASGDEALIADFRRLRDAVGMGVPADSIEALERSIQSRSEAYGSYTSAVDIDMKSVQSVLAANECAIEIVPSMRDSISGYDALVLSHEGVSVVPLFTENEITAALSGDIYDKSSKFGQSLWQKLSKAVGKSRRIYISPDGPFHSIAFEYLSVDGKHRANEVYDISRVSSTREVCLGAQKRAIDDGALFGGIDYNLDSEDKQLALEEAGLVRGHVGENLGKDVMPWLFLPGTLGEVRAIDKSLEKAGKHSRLFTSDLALEEAFYSLSGKSPSILHMATHGFYLPQYQGANPLSKTGLVMAGANHYWREGWNLAPEPHDGILTGTEIAGLDLGNTDLVVLSACQSGLGDVSAEGVFGLPRAFKKSGAGSILMSLWPVHDDATRLLMDEFYKSLLTGKTKQQSLLDAQAAVKRAKFTTPSGTRESGSNPKYWAAFVLLD